jgi:DNA uptake protein ComE-like DNA-binding protein
MRIEKYVMCLFVALSLQAATPQIPGVEDVEKAVTGKAGSLIDLNSASTKQLQSLPGITSTLASQIVKARPFKSTNELVSKNILPQSVYDKIKNLIGAKQK